ncbi:hypothetical protein ACLOJK_020590 [Asimina triloba]
MWPCGCVTAEGSEIWDLGLVGGVAGGTRITGGHTCGQRREDCMEIGDEVMKLKLEDGALVGGMRVTGDVGRRDPEGCGMSGFRGTRADLQEGLREGDENERSRRSPKPLT